MKRNVRTRLKTGDEVVVIAGRDVGKTGTITSIKKNKAFVTGINIVKKHTKPNPQLGITGGIVEQESPIDLSNIQIWDSKTKKRLDKDVFRLNEGSISIAYTEVADRFDLLPKNVRSAVR